MPYCSLMAFGCNLGGDMVAASDIALAATVLAGEAHAIASY